MSVPVDIDKYQSWLALDEDQLIEEHVPDKTIVRICRLRALYTYWCRFPSKSPREVIEYAMLQFRVQESEAYDDMHILKVIVGNLQESSKKFWRWRINQMIEEDRARAKRDGDHRSVAAMQKNLIKNNLTDKEDTPEMAFDKIVPLQIEPTDDPTVIGIKRIPNLRDKVKKMIRKYDAEYADFTEIPADDDGDTETVL
ncbi:MAG: hypothetical protein K5683_02835 [Prevotella sp.]|nr:hypothetical protein [Prevotella sp.]